MDMVLQDNRARGMSNPVAIDNEYRNLDNHKQFLW